MRVSFWPVGQPDNRLPGRLVLDVSKGPVLRLCGWFDDPGRVVEQAHTGLTGTVSIGLSEMLGSGSPPIRILGDTTEGPVSLDHCLVGRASLSFGSSGSKCRLGTLPGSSVWSGRIDRPRRA